MGDIERVRVLVVGDSGVGKTSLTWLLRSGESFDIEKPIHLKYFSHDTALPNPSWTVGCSIEVVLIIPRFRIGIKFFAGEIARVHGGNPAAEVVLCRVVGRGGQSQSEEHKTCLLPHCARHHPCS